MKKAKKKKRSSKYEKPLVINGTFADVIRVAVRDDDVKQEKKKK